MFAAGLVLHSAVSQDPEQPPGAPGHRAPTGCGRRRNGPSMPPEPSRPGPAGHRLRLAVAAAACDGDQDATAALVRQARPMASTRPSCWRWPRPTGPSPAAPPRLAGRPVLDDDMVASASSTSRSGNSGRTGAAAMTEPRLRAVVSALVDAIAAMASWSASGPSRSSPSRPAPSLGPWSGRRRCWSTASPWPPPSRSCARPWPASGPSIPLTARAAAELLGVSCSRAGVLLQQERAALNGQRGER
jgi:hypothetical protein